MGPPAVVFQFALCASSVEDILRKSRLEYQGHVDVIFRRSAGMDALFLALFAPTALARLSAGSLFCVLVQRDRVALRPMESVARAGSGVVRLRVVSAGIFLACRMLR